MDGKPVLLSRESEVLRDLGHCGSESPRLPTDLREQSFRNDDRWLLSVSLSVYPRAANMSLSVSTIEIYLLIYPSPSSLLFFCTDLTTSVSIYLSLNRSSNRYTPYFVIFLPPLLYILFSLNLYKHMYIHIHSLSGYKRSEIVGQNCRFLQGKSSEKEQIQLMSRALATAQPIKLALTNRRKDGSGWTRFLFCLIILKMKLTWQNILTYIWMYYSM